MRKLCMLLLCTALLAGLGGCGRASADPEPGKDEFLLYFREADLESAAGGDALRAETVTLPGVGDMEPQQAAQALVEALLRGPADETLRSAIPAGTSLVSLRLDGRLAVVDMSSGYGTLSGVSLAMADYAVTLTLTQLSQVSAVSVTVRGRELGYRGSQLFRAGDVLRSTTEDVVDTLAVTLYFPDAAGTLTGEDRLLSLYEGDSQVRAVVRALEQGPEDGKLLPVLPEQMQVRSVWLEEAVCYVNLSSAAQEELDDQARVSQALEALARSLCSLDAVEEVRFLVDGEYAAVYAGVPVRQSYIG